MVHALKEACRVLKPRGILIDQRPLSINSPLDIVYRGKSDFVGYLDMTPGWEHDNAADHAIEILGFSGIVKEVKTVQFQVAYYWKNVRGMIADIHERWMDDVIYDEILFKHAYHLFRRHQPLAQVRLIMSMKLVKYKKLGSDEEIK